MSVTYRAIHWNRNKKAYDRVIVAAVVLYLVLFMAVGKVAWRGSRAISDPILLMRALGTCALLMLHVILCIGPLARLDSRFLPLLYNRRHLGVSMFLVGAAHGVFVLGFYHGFGRVNPLVSVLIHDVDVAEWKSLPFQILGVAALAILFTMAATSHDFWLKNLSPRVWKGIHMLVYAAYGLLILHVTLGALQAERSPLYPALLGVGVVAVSSLHIAAGWRERGRERRTRAAPASNDGETWVDAGRWDAIHENRAKFVCLPNGERIAVFRYADSLSAVRSACAHQGGPLAEGRILDGCITCPWHGWQYRPADGRSPPPFQEKVPTYRVRVRGDHVFVSPRALPPGTPVEPARVNEGGES